MWRNVVESGTMWRIVVHLNASHCATWRNVAHIYEPQFAALSHIKPQNMWCQVEPLSAKWRHIGPHSATLSQVTPL